MEVTNSIVKIFPHLFELNSEDRKWYESLEMTEGANMQFNELDIAAKEFALKHIKDCFESGVDWASKEIFLD